MLRKSFIYIPFLMIALCALGLFFPFSREQTLWLLQENRPVEMLTFMFLFAAGLIALVLGFKARAIKPLTYEPLFILTFGILLLIVGLEEISWGQHFIGFETPESMKEINQQDEMNLHNLPGVHGKSEIMRMLFGVGGLIGIYCAGIPLFKNLSVSPLLFSWFLVITIHATADLFSDFISMPKRIDYALSESSELVELMIGIAALSYVRMKNREWKQLQSS